MTYEGSEIWLGSIIYQHDRLKGPRICAFSFYGSPSPLADLAPPPLRRVSITLSELPASLPISLFYTQSEFDNVLTRSCSDYCCRLNLTPDAAKYIFVLTAGHLGAVGAVVEMIKAVV